MNDSVIEAAREYSARVGSDLLLLPVAFCFGSRDNGQYEITDAFLVEGDEGWRLDWSTAGSTAPCIFLPTDWKGSRFEFVPVDPSEPEGDTCPRDRREDEGLGYCRLVPPVMAEGLAAFIEEAGSSCMEMSASNIDWFWS